MGVAAAVAAIVAVAAVGGVVVLFLGSLNPEGVAGSVGLSEKFGFVVSLLRWPVGIVVLSVAASMIYRLAPAREANVLELSLGAVAFGLIWTVSSALLALYASNVNALTATYGTLTGIVAILIWTYLTESSPLRPHTLRARAELGEGVEGLLSTGPDSVSGGPRWWGLGVAPAQTAHAPRTRGTRRDGRRGA